VLIHIAEKRDSSYDVLTYGQNVPRKIGEGIRACYTHGKAPRASWRDYISDLAWSCLVVEPPELPDIAKNRQTLRVLGLLSPRPYPEKKAGVKCEIQRSDRRGSDLA